jgi:hypothetical protein
MDGRCACCLALGLKMMFDPERTPSEVGKPGRKRGMNAEMAG